MNQTTLMNASLEIILAVLGAFILGALFCYLLRLVGLCCRPEKVKEGAFIHGDQPPVFPPAGMPTAVGAGGVADVQNDSRSSPSPAASRAGLTGGGAYEADIDTLIRGGRQPLVEVDSQVGQAAGSGEAASLNRHLRNPAPQASVGTTDVSVAAMLDMPDEDHVDDLKKLEGIGPRIEQLLNDAGIRSYAKLATMDREQLREILQAGGREFKIHDPKSWPYQAELAAKNNWNRLREYQDFLLEGRRL